jgi:hypothetical protein
MIDVELNIYHGSRHSERSRSTAISCAYCLHVTLSARLKPLAPGLTPRAVLDKLAAIQMLDVHCHRSPRRASPRRWGSRRELRPSRRSGDFRGAAVDFIHFFSPIA